MVETGSQNVVDGNRGQPEAMKFAAKMVSAMAGASARLSFRGPAKIWRMVRMASNGSAESFAATAPPARIKARLQVPENPIQLATTIPTATGKFGEGEIWKRAAMKT